MSKTEDFSSGSSRERLVSGLLGQSLGEKAVFVTTRYNSEVAECEDLRSKISWVYLSRDISPMSSWYQLHHLNDSVGNIGIQTDWRHVQPTDNGSGVIPGEYI